MCEADPNKRPAASSLHSVCTVFASIPAECIGIAAPLHAVCIRAGNLLPTLHRLCSHSASSADQKTAQNLVVEHKGMSNADGRSLGGISFGFLVLCRRSRSDLSSTFVRRSLRHPRRTSHPSDGPVGSPFLIRGIWPIAKTRRIGIRLSPEEHRQIQEAVRRLEFAGPSALVRRAIHNELVGRSPAATDSEERVAATLERAVRDVTRVVPPSKPSHGCG